MKDILPGSSHCLFNRTYPAEIAALPRIKSEVLDIARQSGWSGDNLGHLELVLEEAAVNIINHAYPENNGEIVITLIAVEGGLILRLQDAGIPFDPASISVPSLDAAAEDRPMGGLGIHLMNSIADGIEYRRENDLNTLDVLLKSSCKDI